jgi:hypothetical protein
MKRCKELNLNQIITLLKNCKYTGDNIKHCEGTCPLFGECLWYYTGDDSSLYADEND